MWVKCLHPSPYLSTNRASIHWVVVTVYMKTWIDVFLGSVANCVCACACVRECIRVCIHV